MGLVRTKITLRNALDSRLEPYETDALVDTGASLLCVPEHVATQLKLPSLQEREVTTAGGKALVCQYVGPVEVSFGNRCCFVGALVLGEEVLLGALPMEDLDLVISPATAGWHWPSRGTFVVPLALPVLLLEDDQQSPTLQKGGTIRSV